MRIILIGQDRLINRHIESLLEKDHQISVSTNFILSTKQLNDFEILVIHVSKKTIEMALPLVSLFESRELRVLILSTAAPSSYTELNEKKLEWLEIPFVEAGLKAKIDIK